MGRTWLRTELENGTEVEDTVREGDIPTIMHLPTTTIERADGVPCHSIRMLPCSLRPRPPGATSRHYCHNEMLMVYLSSDKENWLLYLRKIILFKQ